MGEGVQIYQWTASYRHEKMYWCDGEQMLLGSLNLDPVSSNTNLELLVSVRDSSLVNKLTSRFEAIKRQIESSKTTSNMLD